MRQFANTIPKLAFAALFSWQASAQQNPLEQVSPFFGAFSNSVTIQVPPFHGLEPAIGLGYSSEGRNGFLGVGWSLSGFSTIQRVSAGLGTPSFGSTDTYVLNGQELVVCQAGVQSPSCATGGTHTTKIESYLKIAFDSGTNSWSVWGRDGTKTTFSPLLSTTGTYRWGQTQVIDTKSNTVTYSWTCLDNDCYPSSATYGPYAVTLYRESRSDVASFAIGSTTTLGQTTYRLRSILVAFQGTPIRAYKLTYGTSAATSRSLLAAVEQFGKDVAIDGNGTITGGTSLPARSFTYQTDPDAKTFKPWPSGSEE